MASAVARFEPPITEHTAAPTAANDAQQRTVLQIRNAQKIYEHGEKSVVAYEDIDLDLHAGEIVCLLGPSGCGKSSLLRMASGLEQPTCGQIHVHGAPLNGPHAQIGVVFQDARLLPWLTVRENIAFPFRFATNAPTQSPLRRLWQKIGRTSHRSDDAIMTRADLEEKIDEILARTGLSEFQDAYPTRISGGMAQRVSLARSLVRSPEIILCDEPFAALDALLRMELQEWLIRLVRDQGASLIFVTHDIEEALFLGDRIVLLTPHPGNIAGIQDVDLPRPRQRDGRTFFKKRSDILDLFRASHTRHDAKRDV